MHTLPIITLKKVYHRKCSQIGLHFTYNSILKSIVKTIPGMSWSTTLKLWYLKNTPDNLKLIFFHFKAHAQIDSSAIFNPKPALRGIEKSVRILSEAHKTVLNGFFKYLKGKRYSESTVATYTFLIADFVSFYDARALESLNNRDVELFIESFYIKKSYAISTQRQFVSALKLFVAYYPDMNIDDLKLERPKRSKILPTVLSQSQVIDLLKVSKNLKHRAILALIYSAGLRISELIDLELKCIYVDRKQLVIKNAKGRKDRYVVLADSFIPLLQNYFMTYRPKRYFVEGPNDGKYSASSIRKFLARYCKDAHIYSTVTPHTLRHSYATHLLEQGINLRYIQELLGHSRPETTMIYTHVARKDILEIKSPLDSAVLIHGKNQKEEQKFHLSG